LDNFATYAVNLNPRIYFKTEKELQGRTGNLTSAQRHGSV